MNDNSVIFHLTNRCQLRCKHCLRDPEKCAVDIPLSLVVKILDEAIQFYKIDHVGLTGGEPTLHPQFWDVVDVIVERGLTWHFISNGFRFPKVIEELERKPKRLEQLTAVDFSLDGADEETHDKIRGKGNYQDVMTAVVLCDMKNIKVLLQMVFNRTNVHQIEEMALNASFLGIKELSFTVSQPNGTDYDKEMFLSISEWRRAEDRIDRLRNSFKMNIRKPEGFYQTQPFHICEQFMTRTFHVNCYGFLSFCCQLSDIPDEGRRKDVVGDLREMSLMEAHKLLVDMYYKMEQTKIIEIADESMTPWDYFPCNWCLKRMEKPFWSDDGAEGVKATRARVKKS